MQVNGSWHWVTAAALAGMATAQDDATQRALQREWEVGVVRMPIDDTTYELVLPPGMVPERERFEDGVRWRYDGQARFSTTHERRGPRPVILQPDPLRLPRADRLRGAVEVDALGRRWIATDIDASDVQQRIDEYDELVDATIGREPIASRAEESEAALDLDTDAGPAIVVPLTWYTSNCDGDSATEIFRWDTDTREESSNPMTIRQKKVVLIVTPNGTGSGTMVDDQWVLTAAHVVSNSSGSLISVSSIDVYTLGNYQTGARRFSVDWSRCPGSYSGDGDVNDDYAVLRLTSSPGVGWMAISEASNSTIEGATDYHSGYPGYGPGCVSSATTPIVSGTAMKQFWSTCTVFNATSNKIKTYCDVGTGQSGGPHYYYPGGCCGSHYLTGVQSSFVNPSIGESWTGGPKGPEIRDWVITYTP